MTAHRTRLALTATVSLIVAALADAYAVAHHLPYALGGHGRPGRVAQDWPSHGTALGPPLLPFVLLVLGVALLMLPSRWGRVGDVVLGLVGVLLLFGTLGEPSTWNSAEPVQVVVRLLVVATSIGLVVLGVQDWRARAAQRVGRTRPDS